VLAAQFMLAMMLGAAMAPGYDFANGAISDLGAVPETAMMFNGALVVVGLLNIAGGLLMFRDRRAPWILALHAVASLGALGAAVFPLGVSALHGLFALVAFVGFNAQTLAGATMVRGFMRWIGVALGVLGFAYVVIMFFGDAGNIALFGPFGHGGSERLIVYPPMIWLMIYGGYLMGRDPARDPPGHD
jgi:hypothetical membrane protein